MHIDWTLTKDTQSQFLLLTLQQMSTSLAQLVLVEQARLAREKQDMPPNVIQALIDLLNKFVALINTDATNLAASEASRAAAQAALDALTASDASAAALVPSAQAAIDAANAALPPATTPAPTPTPAT